MKPEKLILSLSGNGIIKQLISETDEGPYLVRKEIWILPVFDEHPSEMTSAYTHDGKYIGNVETAKRLWDVYGVRAEVAKPDNNVCSIGYSERDGKWYGWSHRAIYGFKPGDSVKPGDCAYTDEKGEWTAETDADAKQMAIEFAESVSSDCLVSVSSSVVTVNMRYGNQL